MLIYQDFRSKIFEKLKEKYSSLEKQDLSLDRTGHGDYALRCFRIAGKGDYGKICTGVRDLFADANYLEKIECDGPYVNFTLKAGAMFSAVHESIRTAGQYPDTFQDPERVVVEHTSTNPTGPIHIGRSRNSIIGDSVARLFSRVGYRVTTQYYVNDSGRQVMAMTLANRLYFKGKKDVSSLLEGYQKIYRELESDPELKEKVDDILRAYEHGDEKTIDEVREICSITLEAIASSLKNLDIRIDDFVFESGFVRHGNLGEIMQDLSEYLKTEGAQKAASGTITEHDESTDDETRNGARYIEMPDRRKVFLQRSDGTSLYFARDIAYHIFKALNADWIIDVLGEDHKDHGKALKYVLTELLDFRARLDFLFYGFVSLETGRMSTRRGTIVTLDDLIEKAVEEASAIVREKRSDLTDEQMNDIAEAVGKSSVRFNMIRVNPDKSMVFRWSEALSFEGDSAPYIIYSYARTSGILGKIPETAAAVTGNFNAEERALLRSIYLYPHYLYSAWESIRPDILAGYVLDLVKSFSDFYAKHSVLKAPEDEIGKRVELVKMYRKILEDACKILGIRLLEEM